MFKYNTLLNNSTTIACAGLEELGYDNTWLQCTFPNQSLLACCDGNAYQNDHKAKIGCAHIGCADYTLAFLAIAALRDDTDKYQYFVSDNNEWYFCYEDKMEKKGFHKASILELFHSRDLQIPEKQLGKVQKTGFSLNRFLGIDEKVAQILVMQAQ